MDSFQLFATLANQYERLRSPTGDILEEVIQSVLVENNLGFQPGGGWYGGHIRGHDFTVIWDETQREKVLGLNPDSSIVTIQNGKRANTTRREEVGPVFMANDSKIKDSIFSMLYLQCKNAYEFAKKCRDTGQVSLSFINDKFAKVQKNNAILQFSGPIEHPSLTLLTIPIQYATLEDEIETKAYLVPFLAGEGAKWLRNRHCEECGKLFFYKLERARFCSQECRIRANNKARREK